MCSAFWSFKSGFRQNKEVCWGCNEAECTTMLMLKSSSGWWVSLHSRWSGLRSAHPAGRESASGRWPWSAETAAWSLIQSVNRNSSEAAWLAPLQQVQLNRYIWLWQSCSERGRRRGHLTCFNRWNWLSWCAWFPQTLLEDFAPAVDPRVPQLLVECVAEIERRGLQEVSSFITWSSSQEESLGHTWTQHSYQNNQNLSESEL